MSEFKLTAKDIKEIDEINGDKLSVEKTLTIALYYHSNRLNELHRKEKEWWDDKTEKFDLDKGKGWTVDSSGSYVTIVEKKKEGD